MGLSHVIVLWAEQLSFGDIELCPLAKDHPSLAFWQFALPHIQLFPTNWQLSTWPGGGDRVYRSQGFLFVAMRKPLSLLGKAFHLLIYCCDNTLRPSQLIGKKSLFGTYYFRGWQSVIEDQRHDAWSSWELTSWCTDRQREKVAQWKWPESF